MSAHRLNIIAFYLEGSSIVVVDAAGREHKVDSPDELWRCLCAIQGDKSLPASTVTPGPDGTTVTVESDDGKTSETYDLIAQGAEYYLGTNYGPVVGRVAAGLIRNGAPHFLGFLRRISTHDD